MEPILPILQNESMQKIAQAIQTVRCGAVCTEEELHGQIAMALEQEGLVAEHEAVIGPRCRIDFLVGDVGVEIKKGRPDRTSLIRQITRYLACDALTGIIVVAPRGVRLPKSIGGKPVIGISLERLWGICV